MGTVISVVLIVALFGLILFEGFQIVKLIHNRFSKLPNEDDKKNEEPKEEQK